ncbi:MAG TPA: DUF4271 domain-containing protein [Puia sp.]|nr:DUF4271 domain-containing protein [Puia sp.]
MTLRAGAQTTGDSIPQAKSDTTVTTGVAPDSAKPLIVPHKIVRKVLADSLTRSRDTIPVRRNLVTDSLRYSNRKPFKPADMSQSLMDLLRSDPYLNFLGNATRVREERFEPASSDTMFYLLVVLLFYFAIIKLAYGKYLGNLLTLFFRVSMRQQQIREQVSQTPVPSLLLNLLFAISGGLYIGFLLEHEQYIQADQRNAYFLYGALLLILIYLGKFIFLSLTGWIFNVKKTTDTYLFIVFLTNKIIGIFLLPFLVILSFSNHLISSICLTGSALMIGVFYFYRLIACYRAVRKEIKLSVLLFLLYLCAFEIAPLLLIYKALLNYLGKAH